MSRKLKVNDAISQLLIELADRIGWKYLKSQRCLKKRLGDLVLQLNLFSSKWNMSYEGIEIQLEFNIWSKKYDNKNSYASFVGYYRLEPPEGNWWTISTDDELYSVIDHLHNLIKEHVLVISDALEEDVKNATIELSKPMNIEKYRLRLRFIDDYAGRQYSVPAALYVYNRLPEKAKHAIKTSINNHKDSHWISNNANLSYIISERIIDINSL